MKFKPMRRRRGRPEGLSEQAHQLLLLIRQLELKGETVTTGRLAALRGTRTGSTNRMLQKLKRKKVVDLVFDSSTDKASREWKLATKKEPDDAVG